MVLLREEVCVWAHATTPWSLMSYTGLSNMCYVALNGEIHLQRWKRWETVTDEPRCFRTVLSKPSWRRDADPANERVHLSAHHDILLSCLMTLPCDSTINTNSKQTVCQGSLFLFWQFLILIWLLDMYTALPSYLSWEWQVLSSEKYFQNVCMLVMPWFKSLKPQKVINQIECCISITHW